MQAVIEYIEVKSIEYPEADRPKVEVCARVILLPGKIKSINKAQIAEAIRNGCEIGVETE
ncbi:MAG: hypothetical protein IKO72_12400 [Kiritimatiellae bacterium]|nr:hypothetical protein [Kiritimatiellia bacterium]